MMNPVDLSALRQEYSSGELDVETVDACPFTQFELWFSQARQAELVEPNAMVLATVTETGEPTQRSVLLKYFDREGFVFFTNYGSRKSKHITSNQKVCLHFPWWPLQRQVEINGLAQLVSTIESIKYFSRRPRESQLGAWVSEQSSVVSSRSLLMAKWEELKQKFADREVPRPEFWGGYRVVPDRFEFWQGRSHRLHDRIEYLREGESEWRRQRLAP